MIERVWPIDGAQVVAFSYEAAEKAWVLATRRARTIISDQIAGRRDASDHTVVDWAGHFRREFDTADADIAARLRTVQLGTTTRVAREITSAAARANVRQEQYNAEELRRRELERQAQEALQRLTATPVRRG